jgi:hypothetical protein
MQNLAMEFKKAAMNFIVKPLQSMMDMERPFPETIAKMETFLGIRHPPLAGVKANTLRPHDR